MELFLRHEQREACCAAHSLAEVYASLTGMPGKHRASTAEAMLFLANVRERLTIVPLSVEEYFDALESAGTVDVIGGGIYDTILGYCALKGGSETIYTWNVKHFERLAPAIAERVAVP